MDANYISYIENYLTKHDWQDFDISRAWGQMAQMRAPLHCVNQQLYNSIYNAIEEFCLDNDMEIDDICDNVNSTDPDEIIFELFNEN